MRISGWDFLFQQTLCMLCLLLALGTCAGLGRPEAGRLLGLSALGGLASAAAVMAGGWLPRAGALVLVALLPRVAWGRMTWRMWLRMLVPLVLLEVLLIGLLRLAQGPLPGLLGVAAGCAGVMLAPRVLRRTPEVSCAALNVRVGAAAVRMTALVDSGNLLRDAVTGLPVIVLSRSAAGCMMSLPAAGELLPGMRYLPIRTAAGSALMLLVRPDAVTLIAGGRERRVEALLGVSPEAEAGFTALVPACLLQDRPGAAIEG